MISAFRLFGQRLPLSADRRRNKDIAAYGRALRQQQRQKRRYDRIVEIRDRNADADLIALTGDWCYMSFDKKKNCKAVFDLIDSYGIPWAPIFGNHDAEVFLSKYDYADMFKEYENCLFDCGYSDIGGAGNYTVVFRDGEKTDSLRQRSMIYRRVPKRIMVERIHRICNDL